MVTNTFKQASPGIPGVGKIMLFMLNALKEHNGKATEEQIQNETIEKIVKERRISSKDRSDLHSEIVRLEDLLLRAGLLAKQGFRALVLNPRALILNDEQIKALPQDPELIEQSLIAEESEARVLPPLPAVDDVAVFLATQLQSQRLAEIELDE